MAFYFSCIDFIFIHGPKSVSYEVISYLLCSRRIPLSWKCAHAMSPGVYECNE